MKWKGSPCIECGKIMPYFTVKVQWDCFWIIADSYSWPCDSLIKEDLYYLVFVYWWSFEIGCDRSNCEYVLFMSKLFYINWRHAGEIQ